MSTKLLRYLPAFVLIALLIPAAAQVTATTEVTHTNTNTNTNSSKPAPSKPHPYTAEFKITRVQTLANGTTITHESTEMQARDSAGRYSYSTTEQRPGTDGQQWTHGYAGDPAANTRSNWDSYVKTATVIQYPPKEQQQGCWANEAGNVTAAYGGRQMASSADQAARLAEVRAQQAQQPKPVVEDLGTSTIQGIEVKGHRIITTIPAGKIGNDQPIVKTQESWVALKLGLGTPLKEIQDDPQTGTSTRELVSLTLGEPDPALLQPAEGYEVKTVELHQVPCAQ